MRASIFRILLGSLCLALSCPPEALAARKAKATAKPPVEAAAPVAPAEKPGTTWTAAEPAHCSQARRKLWQESEGWIVKTVSVCR
ncbi:MULTISPECIES: hypothetical protein [Methylorubrum]|uniref:Uncharacterized protein n=1 Tax=Methylorubrum suomiense TaxID=144191 RepID=A0ABQ4UYJ4_9HYPH|nr:MULTISPECIES: hypothetical protein [Methylobacteriaceae]GJE76478.1 hypothetical protein BGCPKDLD_3072 [Methylorubrum suomiense]